LWAWISLEQYKEQSRRVTGGFCLCDALLEAAVLKSRRHKHQTSKHLYQLVRPTQQAHSSGFEALASGYSAICVPLMSESDIDKGSRGLEEISKALDGIQVGITCLTPENLNAPWLLFEGGALSKRIGEKSRLCTYLLGGLKHGDIPQPLGMFQHTIANKEETKASKASENKELNSNSARTEGKITCVDSVGFS
jgi:hypothetical protein